MTPKGAPVDLAAVRAAREALGKLGERYPELRGPPGPENRSRWEETLEDAMAATNREQDEQLVVRLPKALLDRVDAYAERLREEQPGPAWKRSDVVRLLMSRALDAVEPKARKGKG